MNALQEAEQNIAASAIYEPRSTIPEISLILGPDDFYSLRCAKVVRTVGEMLDAGEEITFITVARVFALDERDGHGGAKTAQA